jgi:hypothetical protein
MLPDFPELKAKIYERILAPRMRAVQAGKSGPFSESPHIITHESCESELVREDATVERSSLSRLEVKVEQDLREMENMPAEALLGKLDSIASEMGEKMLKKNLEKLQSTLEAAGRQVDAAGKPLTADLILDMLEGMLIQFDSKGEPRMPTIVAHPDMARRLARLNKETQDDERLKERYQQIMQKKKDEWDAREASRELVG